MVVLDTDHLSLVDENNVASDRLRSRLDHLDPKDVVTSIITYEEQMRGWLAYLARARTLTQQVEAYRRLARHVEGYRELQLLDFTERAAVELQRLQRLKLRVGTMDLKIAAIALVHDAVLLSRNTRDFRQIVGLRVEDWSQ
jgi:tRNA(fMet)-specific endonuclease VapC